MAIPRGLLLAIRARAMVRGKAPKLRKRRYRQRLPVQIEQEYLRQLLTVLKSARDLVEKHLIPALPSLVARATHDSAAARTDGYVDDVQTIVNLMRREFDAVQPKDAQLMAMLEGLARRVDQFNAAETNKQLKAVLDLEVTANVPQLGDRINAFTRQNVGLIKSIDDQYFKDIENNILTSFRLGRRAEDIATEIRGRYDVSASKAALIARDQIGKFNGELNKARQGELGITRYRWISSKDERVRSLHEEREGMIFRWDKPPRETKDDGHPGTPIQCRCTPDPVIEDILGEAVEGQEYGEEPRPEPEVETPAPEVAPEPTPAPAPEPLPAPRPKLASAVPEDYWKHPTAPSATFALEDATRLRNVLAEGMKQGGTWTPAAQVEIRQTLNTLMAQEGLVSHDILAANRGDDQAKKDDDLAALISAQITKLNEAKWGTLEHRTIEADLDRLKAERLRLFEERAGRGFGGKGAARFSISDAVTKEQDAAAVHEWNGEIVFSTHYAGQAANSEIEKGQVAWGYRTAIHEAVHGHSPIVAATYGDKLGKVLEESTTEAAAQALADRLRLGAKFTTGEMLGVSSEGYSQNAPGNVSYTGYIEAMTRTLAKEAGIEGEIEPIRAFAQASLDMRKTTEVFKTSEDYLDHFMRQIPAFRDKVTEAQDEAARAFAAKLERARNESGLAMRWLGVSKSELEQGGAEALKAVEGQRAFELRQAGHAALFETRAAFMTAAKKAKPFVK